MGENSCLPVKTDYSKKPSSTLILRETRVHPPDQAYSATYSAEELWKMMMKHFPYMFSVKN